MLAAVRKANRETSVQRSGAPCQYARGSLEADELGVRAEIISLTTATPQGRSIIARGVAEENRRAPKFPSSSVSGADGKG